MYPNLPSAPPESPPPYTIMPERDEVEEELRKIEDEIATLKAVLASKQERAAQLKRQLGMYGFDVAKDDMKRAAHSIANSKPPVTISTLLFPDRNTSAYKSVNNSVSSFFKSVKVSICLIILPPFVDFYHLILSLPKVGVTSRLLPLISLSPTPPSIPSSCLISSDLTLVSADVLYFMLRCLFTI
ncbi:unnamed protein product [Hydatigera taeniaeformis]|uniref:PKcGMP_CC domain-containing protein n=1 Tax=Hydatigena taeniaeformis TaxID=6205 RepID=A0A0R3WN28_HYDTA|nr:unnamed protein product [Hydatigera taeniaeformis]